MGVFETQLIETGEKRDGRGRKIRPADHRAEYVRTYQSSGLTMAAFARREGLKYSTFAGWVLKGSARGHGRLAPVRFAEMRLPIPAPSSPAPEMEVRLVDGTVARGTNAVELAALVRALRS
jgi:transposase-like protein